MLRRVFQCFAVVTFLGAGSLYAQNCGADFSGYYGGGTNNCGRAISQPEAMGLWANYCNETCFDFRRHRRGGCGGGCGGRGFGGGGCGFGGCGSGCFSYPGFGAGCGCDAGGRGFGGRHHGGFFGHRNRGFGGHGCGGADFGGFAGGCGADFGGHAAGCGTDMGAGCGGCGSGCFGYGGFAGRSGCGSARSGCGGCGLGRSGCGAGRHQRCCGGFLSRIFHRHRHANVYGGDVGLFATSAANCGCNGAYFSEMVGHEYGTAGIQSAVSGCGSPSFQPSGIDHSHGINGDAISNDIAPPAE